MEVWKVIILYFLNGWFLGSKLIVQGVHKQMVWYFNIDMYLYSFVIAGRFPTLGFPSFRFGAPRFQRCHF